MTSEPDPEPEPDSSDQQIDIRPSPIAGRWYSSSPEYLRDEIDSYLEAELPPLDSTVVGVIAPHAGYKYSGQTAGYAFAAVKKKVYDLVVVLSPLHAYHEKPLLSSAHRAYKTPLGVVPLDQKALLALQEALRAKNMPMERVAYDDEHSLEIELPFLQRALDDPFELLPVMVRSLEPHFLQEFSLSLAEVIRDRKVLLVGSTDLSHFNSQRTAQRYDHEMLHQIGAFSPEGVLEAERRGTGFACGAGAAAAVLWTAKYLGADSVKVLHYSTSADATGDRSSVVGYGAAAILKHK